MTTEETWTVRWHGTPLAVARIPANAEVSYPASQHCPLYADVLTGKTRTLVLPYEHVAHLRHEPAHEGPFLALEVLGPLDFSLTGVLTSLLNPLAEAGISVFTLSTFDTDWILVPAEEQSEASMALTAVGHTVAEPAH